MKKLIRKSADEGASFLGNISRRGFLKTTAFAGAAVAVGCGKGDNDEGLVYVDDYFADGEIKTVYNTGAFNCGSRCVHKIHIKNGRMLALTSAGDRDPGSKNTDEFACLKVDEPIQQRACIRGYGYIQRTYQPDRVKYPLVRTGKRGDVNGFEMVSWDTALKLAAKKIAAAYARASVLKYVPVIDESGLLTALGGMSGYPVIVPHINESVGNVDGGILDSIGLSAVANSRANRYHSKCIISWGIDSTRTSWWVPHSHFMNTITKENGAERVVISPNFNNDAAILGTGAVSKFRRWMDTDTTHNTTRDILTPDGTGATGEEITVNIPTWVPIRPATDGALAVALMYVIYKRGLHDIHFINTNCFGFFNDSDVVSRAPDTGANTYRILSGNPPHLVFPGSGTIGSHSYTMGDKFSGHMFDVPAGKSFREYLMQLENSLWHDGSGSEGDKYYGVLGYASRLTGIKTNVIEALAVKIADSANPTFLDTGGGPQRAYNGAEWIWLIVSLCAMCGHIDRLGCSAGINGQMHTPEDIVGLGKPYLTIKNPYSGSIHVNMTTLGQLLLTGTDYRSKARITDDVAIQTAATSHLDLSGRDKPIEADVFFCMYRNYLTSEPNINKTIHALEKLGDNICLIVAEQVMTVTAQYADIIFPISTHFENPPSIASRLNSYYLCENAIKPMYGSKTQDEFNHLFMKAVCEEAGIPLAILDAFGMGSYNPPKLDDLQAQYDAMQPVVFADKLSGSVKPSWEEFKRKGQFEYVISKENTILGMRDQVPLSGGLDTTTGRVNFYSPFWELRGGFAPIDSKGKVSGAGWRTSTAKYIANREGYEWFFENGDVKNGSFTGYPSHFGGSYKLQFTTFKPLERAHTVMSNVAMIRDTSPQKVKINPLDADARYIKNGDMVYVYNDRGCTLLPAEVTQQIIPGVILIEHGAWYKAHPSKKVKVWMHTSLENDGATPKFEEVAMPVDVGGAENILTDDFFTLDPLYVDQSISVQGGPCEVSLTLPENRRA